MKQTFRKTRTLALSLAIVFMAASLARATEPVPTFERDVRPILKAFCFDCHGAGETRSGNLDLRLRRLAVEGGKSGPAIVPGDPTKSRLIERIKAAEMPPGNVKLSPDQIAVIERWVAAGATTSRDEPEQLPPGIDITPEERSFWAFQPIRPPDVPAPPPTNSSDGSGTTDRIRSPIDAFLDAKLREHHLSFAPDADRRTLMLRASFDLTGLPPAPEELDRFLADTGDDAVERMIDRLLDSPHYGERWARHWLDVAGYADSEGNGNEDTQRPHAYKYRDYVIRALNADLPLDQFIIEQLAGDELVPLPWTELSPQQLDKLVATGFLRTAPDGTASGGGDESLLANQHVADTLKIVGSALLGLSVGCAQCHDHKYDPIPQSDYYRLRAIFEPALNVQQWRRPSQRRLSLFTDADRARVAAVDAEVRAMQTEFNEKQQKFITAAFEKNLEKFPEELRPKLREAFQTPTDKRTDEHKMLLAANPNANLSAGVLYQYDAAAAEELKKDQAKIAAKAAEKPVEDFVRLLSEQPGVIPATHVFHRGDHRQPKGAVQPGDLTIAAPEGQRFEIAERDPQLATSGRRLAFARHLVSGRHPLVSRVLVNRIWLHHFGRGLVDSPGDFGLLGQRPTHPELLDWLADALVRQGWSMKQMHRLIMTSTAYRQASATSPGLATSDAETALYGRFPLRRLEAEIVRDRILATSGRLDRSMLGPPLPIAEDFVGQVTVKDDMPRRSIYLEQRRTKPVSLLAAFDAPTMSPNCDRRTPSTAAQQSLMLMNSDFALKHADEFAARLRRDTPATIELPSPELALRLGRTAEAWQYGYGSYDESAARVSRFTPLPHFTGSAWQGGPSLPDPALGWVIVRADGGHPGDAEHASIRRWVAPRDGSVAISGKLHHPSEHGNGVSALIVSSRSGLEGRWNVKTGETSTDVSFAVQAGDTIDFVLDSNGDVTSDSYAWGVQLTLSRAAATSTNASAANAPPLESETWNSAGNFHGPLDILAKHIAHAWRIAYLRPIEREEFQAAMRFASEQLAYLRSTQTAGDHEQIVLSNLCQQLLSSNEFLYVE